VLPLVNPVTTIGDADPVLLNVAPLDESVTRTIKLVMAEPPTLDGAVKATDTCAFPAVALTIVGGLGTFNGLYEAVMNPPK
jgi:hypothetical protein